MCVDTLFISGNGLDLNSELKSKYFNFFSSKKFILEDLEMLEKTYINVFEQRKKSEHDDLFDFESDLKDCYCEIYWLIKWIEKGQEAFNDSEKNEDLTNVKGFFDLLGKVINKKDYSYWMLTDVMEKDTAKRWSDIEKNIGNYITKVNKNGYLLKHLDILKDELSKRCLYDNDSIIDFDLFMIIAGFLNRFYSKESSKNKSMYEIYEIIDEIDVNEFLFLELEELENSFSTYLRYEVERKEYKKNVVKNISKIVGNDNTNILNFNYTKYKDYLNEYENEIKTNVHDVVNIHGNLDDDNHIIFGIDSKLCEHKEKDVFLNMPMFTKTYRIMSRTCKYSENIFNIFNSMKDSPYKKIKFFGHSLSEADYSYFQSIFDSVNLYSSNVMLEFYYSKHTKNASFSEIDLHKTENDVFRLLDVYGQTLANKDHGKNLLHKLLLEGRLVIKELK